MHSSDLKYTDEIKQSKWDFLKKMHFDLIFKCQLDLLKKNENFQLEKPQISPFKLILRINSYQSYMVHIKLHLSHIYIPGPIRIGKYMYPSTE